MGWMKHNSALTGCGWGFDGPFIQNKTSLVTLSHSQTMYSHKLNSDNMNGCEQTMFHLLLATVENMKCYTKKTIHGILWPTIGEDANS